MPWEYKTIEALMKVLLRKGYITKEEANKIVAFLEKESYQIPAEVSVLLKKLHSVFDMVNNAIELEAENRPARKEDETDEDSWYVGYRSYSDEEMCKIRELAKEILETIESSKAFDEKFGIWNFDEYDKEQSIVMQEICYMF